MGTGVGEALILEAMVTGAATGAGTAAITGGDPLEGALLGALGGGAGAGIAGATSGAATGATTGTTTAAGGSSAAAANQAALQASGQAANQAATQAALSDPSLLLGAGDTGLATQTYGFDAYGPGTQFGQPQAIPYTPSDVLNPAFDGTAGVPGGQGVSAGLPPQSGFQRVLSDLTGTNIRPSVPNVSSSREDAQQAEKLFPNINKLYERNRIAYPAVAGASTSAMFGRRPGMEEEEEYGGPLSDFRYSRSSYTPFRAASGGLMDTAVARRMAGGGLGSYSDGGQTLQGPGDGMSDSIPATIGGAQPARLADGEFVVPADVVSGIGNGSTDAGARQLYSMMDKVREARTGRTRQAPEINPRRMMPT